MFKSRTGRGPRRGGLRLVAWLLAGAMLYAGGLGHLLHPWLHPRPPASCHPPAHGEAGPRLRAPAMQYAAHHACALCAFLAHYLAQEPAPATRLEARLVPLSRPGTVYQGPLATVDFHLPDSRSPPRKTGV